MRTYSDKLKDPRWQRKRLEIMERDDFKCSHCGRDDKTLSVHHTYYVSGREPWNYPSWSLQTLCEKCHKDTHDHEKDIIEAGEEWSPSSWEAIIGFLGTSKISDFEDWWDISVMLAMRSEEFKARGIRPVDWMMWAYESLSKEEFYMSQSKVEKCMGCLYPRQEGETGPAHSCKRGER